MNLPTENDIIEAAFRASMDEEGRNRSFSLNDVYFHLGFTRSRSVQWADRMRKVSPGIIRSVIKKNGFVSVARSGGSNVCRYSRYSIKIQDTITCIQAIQGTA